MAESGGGASTETGRITGIGGIFVEGRDAAALMAWYRDVLGMPVGEYGANFSHKDDPKAQDAYSVWYAFKAGTEYLKPSDKGFMINFRVDDLDAFLARLKGHGMEPLADVQDTDEGRFAWILDPDGTKIELWQQKGGLPG